MIAPRNEAEVDVSVEIPVDQALVWGALVHPDQQSGWWPHMHLEAVVGSRFEERWSDASGRPVLTSGTVVVVSPPHRMSLTWSDDDWDFETEVHFLLDPSAFGTCIRVIHRGLQQSSAPATVIAAHRDGWRHHLLALKRFCAGS